ncbi:hypothetical protein [Nocardia sp. NPDC005825]|uniref:hypothetical protein n=1 Tax=unclassified Nocardia TaxID=2637762 RepID=UPI0033FB06C7
MRIPAWLAEVWRLVRIPLIPVVLYLVLRPVLALVSARHGFGSPDGLGPGYLALSAILTGLRMIVLVGVPAYLAYRVVVAAITRLPGARR